MYVCMYVHIHVCAHVYVPGMCTTCTAGSRIHVLVRLESRDLHVSQSGILQPAVQYTGHILDPIPDLYLYPKMRLWDPGVGCRRL